MEQKNDSGENSKPSLLGEIFAMTNNGNSRIDSAARAEAVHELHARLGSSEFVDQMTGVFYEAKRAALTSSK